ncbi:MAG: ABC transporter ATP-binding protein [Spirochaetota bacterium]
MSILTIDELSCGYNGEEVLHAVSFSVKPGQIIALIGPNGSGKTTLLRAMCRLIKPWRGRVFLDQKDLWSYPPRKAAQKIALVYQAARLVWPFTVQQAVSLGRFPHKGWISSYSAEDHASIENAIQATGLWEHRNRSLNTLSGGEFQRAMIARALAQSPRILLLDEPVAHLDMKYKIAVLDLIRQLALNGLGVVVSLHDLNLAAMYAHQVALLNRGSLYAMGDPGAILVKENLETVFETRVLIKNNTDFNKPVIMPLPPWLN